MAGNVMQTGNTFLKGTEILSFSVGKASFHPVADHTGPEA